MLVIEVALGVALGLALFRYLSQIVGGLIAFGAVAVVLALLVGVVAAVGLLLWFNLEMVATVLAAMAGVALLYGVPFLLKDRIERRYPSLRALVLGEPPYNRASKLPIRLAVMTPLALVVAGAGVGALLGGVYIVDMLSRVVGGR